MKVINKETIDRGICLIDVYRAPGDLHSSWDIVPISPDGTFPRLPDAGYGPDARDRDVEDMEFEPLRIVEIRTHLDDNGWSKWRTEIRGDGKIITSKED